MKIKEVFSKLKEKIVAFFSTPTGVEVEEIVLYGVVINFLLTGVYGLALSLWTMLGWGLVYYFLVYEIPLILGKYKAALE